MTNHSSADQNEKPQLELLDSLNWEKAKNILHIMNTLRIPFVRDGLMTNKQVKSEKPFENLSIMVAGCGGGILAEPLARLGGKVVGIDAAAEAIKVAKKHAALDSTLTNLTYLNEKVGKHAKEHREKYDAVIASDIIEYVFNPEKFLIQSLECLKPGGSIFITTINQTMASFFIIFQFYVNILGVVPRKTYEHGKFRSPKLLTELLEKQNCSIKSIRGIKYNIFSNTMDWTDNTSNFYALHAVKNK